VEYHLVVLEWRLILEECPYVYHPLLLGEEFIGLHTLVDAEQVGLLVGDLDGQAGGEVDRLRHSLEEQGVRLAVGRLLEDRFAYWFCIAHRLHVLVGQHVA